MTTRGLSRGVGAGRGLVRGLVVVSLLLVVIGLAPAAQAQAPGSAEAEAEAGSSNWREVSANGMQSCGIRTSGRLYCWGSDYDGQLGNGGANIDRSRPVQVAGGFTNWASVTVGWDHACAIKTTGRLYCWGSDSEGQLGNGMPNTDRSRPVQVAGANWASVNADGFNTCAIKTTGQLYCWGSDDAGQLGYAGDDIRDRSTPVQVTGRGTDWAAVDAGGLHTCAVKTTGRLYCWGSDFHGQLGNGRPSGVGTTPGEVLGRATNWASVTASNGHTCAVKTNGRLFCWGWDGQGQLGNGTPNTDRSRPVQVAGGATNWASVTAGYYHTCAHKTNGRLYCWGGDVAGALGNGGANTDRARPVQVAGGFTNWAGVSAGYHTCAIKTTGRLYCWGYDSNGQLGNGPPNTSRFRPAQV